MKRKNERIKIKSEKISSYKISARISVSEIDKNDNSNNKERLTLQNFKSKKVITEKYKSWKK